MNETKKQEYREYQRKYQRKWRANNKEKAREVIKKWIRNNPDKWKAHQKRHKEKMKRQGINYNDNYYFGRPKKELLELYNYQCAICDSKERLEVHHIDGKGSKYLGKRLTAKEKNNSLNNLIILCFKCHRRIDQWKRTLGLKKRYQYQWSMKFSKCLVCGTTERKHCIKGLCSRCYERTRKEYKAQWWKEVNGSN